MNSASGVQTNPCVWWYRRTIASGDVIRRIHAFGGQDAILLLVTDEYFPCASGNLPLVMSSVMSSDEHFLCEQCIWWRQQTNPCKLSFNSSFSIQFLLAYFSIIYSLIQTYFLLILWAYLLFTYQSRNSKINQHLCTIC